MIVGSNGIPVLPALYRGWLNRLYLTMDMYMKRIILTSLILTICCTAQAVERKVYFNDDLPPNAGSYPSRPFKMGDNTYHMWDDKTQSYTTYTVDGDNVYSSDGYRYTIYGNGTQLQNNSTGERYQKTGDYWEPLR